MANNETGNLSNAMIGDLITKGLDLASKKDNSLQKKDVASISATVKKEVAPVVENATNQEPWYKSRVIIGTVISMVFMGAGVVGYQSDLVQPGEITDMIMDGVALLGAAYALYGRLVAGLKPIGE